MRIAVISDLHHDERVAEYLYSTVSADRAFILGDGCQPVTELLSCRIPVTAVGGNCDIFGRRMLPFAVEEAQDVKFFLTHGHRYELCSGYGRLAFAAKSCGCSFALFGHTHIACIDAADGVTLFNPGSASRPRSGNRSYGVLEWDGSKFLPKIIDILPENC